jgi:hypothetical protein
LIAINIQRSKSKAGAGRSALVVRTWALNVFQVGPPLSNLKDSIGGSMKNGEAGAFPALMMHFSGAFGADHG